jgi:hypothetical protein
MRKRSYFNRKQLEKRVQALVLVAALTVTNFTTPVKALASTDSGYRSEISATLNNVLSGMASGDAYQEAVNKLSTSLDNLQGAA